MTEGRAHVVIAGGGVAALEAMMAPEFEREGYLERGDGTDHVGRWRRRHVRRGLRQGARTVRHHLDGQPGRRLECLGARIH